VEGTNDLDIIAVDRLQTGVSARGTEVVSVISSMEDVWSELEGRGLSKGDVQAAVDENLPYFEDKSAEYLQAVVGQAEIGSLLTEEDTSREQLVAAGLIAFRRWQIRDVVCEAKNRKLIEEFITTANVTSLTALLLTTLGIGWIVAPIIIALAVLILKIGLNQYCSGVPEEETATS